MEHPATPRRLHAHTTVIRRPEAEQVPGNPKALALWAAGLVATGTTGGVTLAAAAATPGVDLPLWPAMAGALMATVLWITGCWLGRKAWLLRRAQRKAARDHARVQRLVDGLSLPTLERVSGLLLRRWMALGPDHMPSDGAWTFTLEWAVERTGCRPHRVHLLPIRSHSRQGAGASTPAKKQSPPFPLTNPGILEPKGGAFVPAAIAAPEVDAKDWLALPPKRGRRAPLRLRVRIGPIALGTAHARLATQAALHHGFPPFYEDTPAPPTTGQP